MKAALRGLLRVDCAPVNLSVQSQRQGEVLHLHVHHTAEDYTDRQKKSRFLTRLSSSRSE